MKATEELLFSVENRNIDPILQIDLKDALEVFDTDGLVRDYYLYNMKQREIAIDRGISISAVSRKIKKIIVQMKKAFND
jgi:DNA-directed RNA polymerase specialized sigma subunit